MWSGQWSGPEPADPDRASNMTIVLRAGPGHTFCGPGLIIQFAGRARAGSAQLLRAWASNHICGPGLGLSCRALVVSLDIYTCTTKIDGVVCPPNISETVAVTTVKLAHRPRIASTTIKFISKPILLAIL